MKLSFTLIFCLLFSSIYSQTKPDINNTFKIAEFEKLTHHIGNTAISKSNKSIGCNYNVKYHRFNWYIDPNYLYIKGSVTTYFTTTKDNVTNISFELSSVMNVDSVKSHNIKLTFNQTIDNELSIALGKNLALNTIDSITVYYQGAPPQDPANIGSFSVDHHGINNSIPILSTLSEPYGSQAWWPCKQSLNDKIDSVDIFVTTPMQYRTASNGILVSDLVKNYERTCHWKHRYPIAAYLIGIAVTNYAVYSDWVPLANNKKLEVLNYVYPEDSADLRPNTAQTPEFIQLFTKLFAPYPFLNEKYGHAQWNIKGGMEHQTMTFIGPFSYEIISHELAHQWFGDAITTGCWHDIWLNEGFATYCTGLCYQYIDPGNPWWPDWKSQNIDYVTMKPTGSVYCADTANQDRVFDARLSYYKGAMFLHTIRWVIGDSAFFHAIRNYLADTKLYMGYAITSDFKSHLEAEAGKDLTWLFDDWFYGEGYPIYAINVLTSPDNNILVTLDQTTSANISFFKLPVPIRFEADGKDTTIVFDNTFSGQSFNAKLSFTPTSITFDPDMWLLAHSNYRITVGINDNSNIASQITISPNPAKDNCYINSVGLNIQNIQLLDLTGKLIQNSNIAPKTSDGVININLQSLSKGIFFLKILTDKGPITKKLIHL